MGEQFIFILLLGLIGYLVIKIFINAPGLLLQSKFNKIGALNGLSKQEIVNRTGAFKSISHLEDGGQICVWQAAAFLITIQFDREEKFVKIVNQTVAK